MADGNESKVKEGLLGRSIESESLFGKCDDTLPELRMPGEAVLELERRWRADGYPNLSAWRRDLYYVALYGIDHVTNLRSQRERRAFGNVGRVSEPTQGAVVARAEKGGAA